MSEDEMVTQNAKAPCPIELEMVEGGISIGFGDDPLFYIVQTPSQIAELRQKIDDILSAQ